LKPLIILLIIPSVAFSIVLHDQTIDDTGDVHIFDGSDGPASMLPFSPWDTSSDCRIAADYVPPSGETAVLRGFGINYCYAYDNVQLGDMYIDVYDTDLDSAPIAEIFVDAGDIDEYYTGWDSPTNGFNIYFGEMIFDEADWVDGLVGGNTYWISARMDSSNGVFCVTVDHDDWEEGYWYRSFTGWQSVSEAWPGTDFDFAVLFRGGGLIGIESSSIGAIKAVFGY